ncbi:hypothetical protein ALC57_19068 [Trachymyrmex cornetzi]|uniref:Uncharacterized protein n=1 Tax=Trachymyrmex cornetzi TaxID=471704 RepID=A0A151IR19_9HYME|nr:hypothetical protein ALC57_19068 [Trachymyrmex cornetzi]
MEEGPSSQSWASFKEAITKRFKRRIPFHIAMQKVEARKWNFDKESFQEYATHKLKLLHSLRLPEQDRVQILINGINSASLRATATALKAVSINDFLESMYEISSCFGTYSKKTSPLSKRKEKTKTSPPSPSKKDRSTTEKDEFCIYCKAKGHSRTNCFKLRKKEGMQPATPTPTSVAAAEEAETAASEKSTIIAGVENASQALKIDDIAPKVKVINDVHCELSALLDTGSPASFILPSIQYVMNNTIHSSIGSTPSKLLLGYDLRNHADHEFVDTLTKLAEADGFFDSDRDARRQLAIEATKRVKDYNKIYYDKKHRSPSKYKVGESHKLKPDYKGPYIIDKVLSSNRYVIKDIPGHNLSPGPYNSILSSDRIKAWVKP